MKRIASSGAKPPAAFLSTIALTLLGTILSLTPTNVGAQGCVASRGSGSTSCAMPGHMGDAMTTPSGWEATVGYRWLNSDRHFIGDREQTQRQAEGSQVINDSHFTDIGITYHINPRFSLSAALPFVINDRSQVVRSNDVARTILGRFATQSAGIGDVRLEANAWILDPATHMKGNINLGLGLLIPTGQKDARDTFQVYSAAAHQVVAADRTVDQSIQPGGGGWGVILDLYAYQEILPRLNAYVNASYTITPEEMNGVPTYRSNPFEAIMSVGDSYMGRAGFDYVLWPKHNLTLSLGGRIDGVPVYDVIGGSNGFRRPGYSISIEPGVSVSVNSWSFNLSTPVAVYRNRETSVPDMQQQAATGTPQHGDAAFTDFSVLFSVRKSF